MKHLSLTTELSPISVDELEVRGQETGVGKGLTQRRLGCEDLLSIGKLRDSVTWLRPV